MVEGKGRDVNSVLRSVRRQEHHRDLMNTTLKDIKVIKEAA
jgi:hypothetical protein